MTCPAQRSQETSAARGGAAGASPTPAGLRTPLTSRTRPARAWLWAPSGPARQHGCGDQVTL